MVEPEKPFACSMPDCGMTFTNEDHLHVHTKKHDMVLQFGLEQKAAFVADQTPTPTRFIRNCEEVGLFLDLPNDNPFEEGFKRAMETAKHGLPSMEHPPPSTEDLHTPQMVFPLIDQTDSALYTTNNQRNITISRSSSDESGAIKEYETTTISKLTNEVTTISRRVEKHDTDKQTDDTNKNIDRNKDSEISSVSYTNNVIKIRKDNLVNVECSKNGQNNFITYTDSIIKDVNIAKDVLEVDKLQVPPIMSQKSIDYVVDSLTSEICKPPEPKKNVLQKETTKKDEILENDNEYTVTITLPTGKKIKMKSVDEQPRTVNNTTKERLKTVITNKVVQALPVIQNIGTLIPVTIIPQVLNNKIPILPLAQHKSRELKRPVKRRKVSKNEKSEKKDDDCMIIDPPAKEMKQLTREDLNSRVAASRRYRARLRETMNHQVAEISSLKEANQKLVEELALLKLMITDHARNCPNAADLRIPQHKPPQGPENT